MMETFGYQIFESPYGEVGLVWTPDSGISGSVIRRIFLPDTNTDMRARIHNAFPDSMDYADVNIGMIMDRIRRYLSGERVEFSLDALELKICGAFRRRVLQLEFQIPYGRVSTYGMLADCLGSAGAARAVGTALARNPFPLIVPCHRTVRSDGTLGGFGGGMKMKRALLELEGVAFDRYGRVMEAHYWPTQTR